MKRLAVIALLIVAGVGRSEVTVEWRGGVVERPGLKLGKPEGRPYTLDFRYPPTDWQTAICLPDDWQKTLVGKDGALLYDYPGDFNGFGTRVSLSLSGGGDEWIGQELDSPRVPIVVTRTRRDGVEMKTQAFAVTGVQGIWPSVPTQEYLRRSRARGVQTIGTHNPMAGWAKPSGAESAAFANVDVGWNGALRYRFRAASGKSQTIVFGFCEGYWSQAGKRVMELKIDGQTKATVDPFKTAGRNVPFVVCVPAADLNGDGEVDIEVAPAASSSDKNTILNMLWVFDSAKLPDSKDIVNGAATARADCYLPCGEVLEVGAADHGPRADLLLATIANTKTSPAEARPVLTVRSQRAMRFEEDKSTVWINSVPMIGLPEGVRQIASGDRELKIALPVMRLAAGESRQVVIAVHRNADAVRWSVSDSERALKAAREFWGKVDLPYDHIRVPDANLQALLDSSVRNIYQAREMKDGLPAFQVGPTCYRGLWIVDGAFLLEAVTLLNRPTEARAGVQYMLNQQNEDGSFELLKQHWKETGIVLWVIDRHEQLTGDRAWLNSAWPRVEKAVGFIKELRRKSSQDPKALYAALVPPGSPDGGLGGPISEYTNVYWLLVGLKSAVQLAGRTGHVDEATDWQREYDSMWEAFRKAARRDLYTDSFGNRMLPVPMDRPLSKPPHKALWAFCHAVYPGELFGPDDPLMLGTMASLTDNECEGLVKDTGWVDGGLWNYFGGFYGQAFMWLGQGEKAARVLYSFGNHASPLLAWREEQMPRGGGPQICGDMPHNWASAEFIRLAMHLLVFERGDELHLLEGLPSAWLKPGAEVAARDVLTRFGPVSLKLKVADDGREASIEVQPPTRTPANRIVLHTGSWGTSVRMGTQSLEANRNSVSKADKPLRFTVELEKN